MDGLPEGWSKQFSKSKQRSYYFNARTGETSWEKPLAMVHSFDESDAPAAKRSRPEAYSELSANTYVNSNPNMMNRPPATNKSLSMKAPAPEKIKVAIIVPFRDLHETQKRQQHLDEFIPRMTAFMLQENQLNSDEYMFKIYIIEQSNDARKFNRGKLLNIGFKIASNEGCHLFLFHDVDLIPSNDLLPWYTKVPKQPAHVARVWNRYNDNAKYFGGVVSFSKQQFMDINGFPNNFWGWGGEDDEMYRRVLKLNLKPVYPQSGSFEDLEEMDLGQKLKFLKQNPTWKCMNKTEVLQESATGESWRRNGLSNLQYNELNRRALNVHSERIIVDVRLNDHWTDLVCHVEDMQYDKKVEDLKAQFDRIKEERLQRDKMARQKKIEQQQQDKLRLQLQEQEIRLAKQQADAQALLVKKQEQQLLLLQQQMVANGEAAALKQQQEAASAALSLQEQHELALLEQQVASNDFLDFVNPAVNGSGANVFNLSTGADGKAAGEKDDIGFA